MDEFSQAYEEEFGERLSDDEIREIALRLLRFFGILKGGELPKQKPKA